MNKSELRLLNQIDNQNRIDQLIREIRLINSSEEYFRLKYYRSMIYKIKLEKSYIGVMR